MPLHQLVGPLTESQQLRADTNRDAFNSHVDREAFANYLVTQDALYWAIDGPDHNYPEYAERRLCDSIWVAAGTVR